MRPARFVTLCFLYSGLILLAQTWTIDGFQMDLVGISQLGVGLSILAVGLVRMWYPEEEDDTPAEWGIFTYGMGALAIFLTAIFLVQLIVL